MNKLNTIALSTLVAISGAASAAPVTTDFSWSGSVNDLNDNNSFVIKKVGDVEFTGGSISLRETSDGNGIYKIEASDQIQFTVNDPDSLPEAYWYEVDSINYQIDGGVATAVDGEVVLEDNGTAVVLNKAISLSAGDVTKLAFGLGAGAGFTTVDHGVESGTSVSLTASVIVSDTAL
ncbi:hypothetical protein [Vibrio sp. CyArs1]|uniref:hypothetical protein n=1 Tax=Vibrio sp. CyArs1 TaxID=2682577 RepID=UPI001F0703B3|nr:hypothetical protein [Vibrio sp. CyArs1]